MVISLKSEEHQEFLGCLAVFLFILCSPETVLVGTNSSALAAMISRYSPFLACGVMIFIYALRRKVALPRSCVIALCISVICFCITAFFSEGQANMMNILYHCAAVLSGVLIVGILPIKDFVRYFEKVMFFLAIYSLVCFGIANISTEIIKKFPVLINTGDVEFYCMGLAVFTKYSMVDSFFLRNYGMFGEPGVYQMFLNFALCCYLFCKTTPKKLNAFHITVYLAAILTTASTTGIFSVIVLILAFVAGRNTGNRKIKRWVLGGGVFVVAVVLSGWSDKLLYAVNKLSDKNTDSMISRMGSITVNLQMFLEHPLIGFGRTNMDSVFAQYLNTRASAVHNTNTILFMYACYGVLFGSLFLYGNVKLMCRMSRDPVARVLLCVFYMLMLSGENLTNSYYIYTLLMYGYLSSSVIGEENSYENRYDQCVEHRQYGTYNAWLCKSCNGEGK